MKQSSRTLTGHFDLRSGSTIILTPMWYSQKSLCILKSYKSQSFESKSTYILYSFHRKESTEDLAKNTIILANWMFLMCSAKHSALYTYTYSTYHYSPTDMVDFLTNSVPSVAITLSAKEMCPHSENKGEEHRYWFGAINSAGCSIELLKMQNASSIPSTQV